MNIPTIISIFGASLFTWLVLAIFFAVATNLTRVVFIVAHYATSLVATIIFFGLLYKFLPTFAPFWTMITAMISFFIIELIVFNFFYKEELWFLNFVDWMIPVFIISTTIYGLGVYFS